MNKQNLTKIIGHHINLKKKNLAKYFLFDVIVTFLFLMVHATLSSITRLLCMQQVSLFQI